MFSKFYWLDLYDKTCVGLANLQWSIKNNRNANWISLYFVMAIGSACTINTWVLRSCPTLMKEQCKSIVVLDMQIFRLHRTSFQWHKSIAWDSYACNDVCSFLNWIHRSSQLCSPLSVEVLMNFEDIVQSLSNTRLLWCLFFDPHQTTLWSSIDVQWREVNQITPANLKVGWSKMVCFLHGTPRYDWTMVH